MSTAGVALPGVSGALRFSHQAMNTVFEIVCAHPDPPYARQAAWAAFDVAGRLEQELSRFIENSDISRINSLAAGQSVRVNRWTMECLELARLAWAETAGAFDISLGSGLGTLSLDPLRLEVRANASGVRLDLGGIGKGYAVDRMAEVLAEWGVGRALIHAGFSSVLALEAPEGCEGWPLTMSPPEGAAAAPFILIQAKRRAFSASGTQKGDHIVDPRTGQPARLRRAAWASAPVGALADFCRNARSAPAAAIGESPAAVVEAFSTAFLILDARAIEDCCRKYPGLESWTLDNRIVHFPDCGSSYDEN
jgi:thiamine biosynthesis lipoprotein